MRYIIISGEDSITRGEAINKELYRISRPNPDPEYDSENFLSSYIHEGKMALGFEDSDFLPVSELVNVDTLKTLLSQEVDSNELNNLEAFVRGKKGDKIYFVDIIPRSVNIYTREELETFGWFPDVDTII